jgi:uncharacterized protein (DUF4415 family)
MSTKEQNMKRDEPVMKDDYDFSKGRRGTVLPPRPGKTRITIRIDDDILEWFRNTVEASGGGNYQTLINEALRQYVSHANGTLEATLRRIIREEFQMREHTAA